jgi:signal transduction histidine kinase
VAAALGFSALGASGRDTVLACCTSALAFAAGAFALPPEPASPASRERPTPPGHGAERARHELLALHRAVSHELRSPLRGVLDFAAVLEIDHGPRLDPGSHRLLGRIRGSAEEGIAVLDALRRLSDVERLPLQPEALEVGAIVRDTFAELKPERALVELLVAELPTVVADRALLQTAFRELLANGLKFSAGRRPAHLAVSGRAAEGEVVYSVADDGVGFEPEYAGKLFQVFERGHAREKYPGAGVGLAVVRCVAERHGGRVWAEAEPEQGARVHLALPARARA